MGIVVTREKRTQVDHGIREVGGVENFTVVYLVGTKSVVLYSHLHRWREKGEIGEGKWKTRREKVLNRYSP